MPSARRNKRARNAGGASTAKLVEQARGVAVVQRRQRQVRRQAGVGQVGQHVRQRIPRPDLVVTVGRDHAQGRARRGAEQGDEQIKGIVPGPLQIVEHEQRAGRTGDVGQEAGHGAGHQPPLLLRHHRPGRQRLEPGLGELRQQPRQPRAPLQRRAQPRRLYLPDTPLQRLEQRRVGLLAAAPQRAPAQRPPPITLGAPDGLLQQARLADARFPRQQQRRRPRAHQALLDHAKLVRASDQRRRGVAARAAAVRRPLMAARRDQEQLTIGRGEVESRGQQPHGGGERQAPAALEHADVDGAVAGACSQFLLRQAGGATKSLEQHAENRASGRTHISLSHVCTRGLLRYIGCQCVVYISKPNARSVKPRDSINDSMSCLCSYGTSVEHSNSSGYPHRA